MPTRAGAGVYAGVDRLDAGPDAQVRVRSLLVTNDFPPKVGGIQSYLWELWRRLDAEAVTVLTTAHPDGDRFDATQPFRVVRARQTVLLATPALAHRIERLAEDVGAEAVLLDPLLPLGGLSRWLHRPYGVVAHGAEIVVAGRIPLARRQARSTLRGARLVICGGDYVGKEAEVVAGQALPRLTIPPGVDVERFRPLTAAQRASVRRSWAIPDGARLVLGVGRLVPRKGFDVLVEAAARLAPGRSDLLFAIAGSGRQREWLERYSTSTRAPVRLLSKVNADQLADLHGAADVFASPCRVRWGGLEQEGFGIVFLEAAASGVPAVGGASGGVGEAVIDGLTGSVVDHPEDPRAVAGALAGLLDDPLRRRVLGSQARQRVVRHFDYDLLAKRLDDGLQAAFSGARSADIGLGSAQPPG